VSGRRPDDLLRVAQPVEDRPYRRLTLVGVLRERDGDVLLDLSDQLVPLGRRQPRAAVSRRSK
jgi:hypothetical protein